MSERYRREASDRQLVFVELVEIPATEVSAYEMTAELRFRADRDGEVVFVQRYTSPEKARRILERRGFVHDLAITASEPLEA